MSTQSTPTPQKWALRAQRGLWEAIEVVTGLHVGYLVTEARGRLAEPIAYLKFDPADPCERRRNLKEAQAIQRDPAAADALRWHLIYLRGRRDNWYPWMIEELIFIDGYTFLGRFVSETCTVVWAPRRRQPNLPPAESRADITVTADGAVLCPHCGKPFRRPLYLVHHLDDECPDPMTHTWLNTVYRAIPNKIPKLPAFLAAIRAAQT